MFPDYQSVQGPAKYFGDRTDMHGHPLSWPGTEAGIPVSGLTNKLLRSEEIEQLPVIYNYKAEVLTLPADLEKYIDIKDRCANGRWILSKEDMVFVPADKLWMVFISWLEAVAQAS